MKVEVAYALPDRQQVVALELDPGATANDALRASGLLGTEATLAGTGLPQGPAGVALKLSVFGRIVAPEHALRDGDRVEVLRPLQADPKEVRRKLAAQGRSMGRRPGGAG